MIPAATPKVTKKYELTAREIELMCEQPIISLIPEDSKVPESISKGMPVCLYSKNSKAAIQLRRLGAYIIGEEYHPRGLWSRIKSFFGSG